MSCAASARCPASSKPFRSRVLLDQRLPAPAIAVLANGMLASAADNDGTHSQVYRPGCMITRRAACSCGQLALVAEGEPIRISMCHCLACQRRTGSAFGIQARFASDHVRVVGRYSDYVRTSDEGDRDITF